MDIQRLATWNVRTVDNEVRRNKILQSLRENNIQIACLQETKLTDCVFDEYNDYTFVCPGQVQQKCPHGVGFVCTKELFDLFNIYPENFTNYAWRLTVSTINLNSETIYIVNVYAPTEVSDREDKDAFYISIQENFSKIPSSATVFIIGDFNAQVGADNFAWPTCIGPYGVGKINDNGQRLLEFCSLHDLCVLNTYTKLPESEQFTHRNASWSTWSQLDLCLTRVRDRHKVISTQAVANLIDSFDHKMVILEIDLNVPNIQPNLENIEKQQTLFRYLLRSVPIVIETKKSLAITKKKDALIETLFSKEIFENNYHFIKILKEFIDKNEKYFDNHENIPTDAVIEDFTFTIIKVSKLFLNEVEIELNILFEEVKRYMAERQEVKFYEKADVLKAKLSKKEKTEIIKSLHEYSEFNPLEYNVEEYLKTETVKCCEDCVLPREFLYLFIRQQCMYIANQPIDFPEKDFCTYLRHILSKRMLTRLKSKVTDDMLQQHHIFKCTEEKEMLFALNLLQEKCLQKVVPLYIVFVDISQILASGKTAMFAQSFNDKPSWALYLPLLFSKASGKGTHNEIELMTFLLSYILTKSFDNPDGQLKVKYRFDGKLFNKSRLDAKKTKTFALRVIKYNSYAAVFSTEINDIKKCIENIEKICNSIGLSFVLNEPLILEQNVGEFATELPKCSKTTVLSENVNFLGVNFNGKQFSMKTDTFLRIHNACKRLQKEPTISYEDILKDLTCHLEVLSLTKNQEEALDKFNERCLRHFNLQSDPNGIPRRISSARMDLLGAYHRDKSDSIAKRLLYGDLDVERQNLCYFSNLKKDLKSFKIEETEWQTYAEHEKIWKSKI